MDDAGTLAFVEVKTRAPGGGRPEDAVGPAKRRRLLVAARAYLHRHRGDPDRPWRFDVVAVESGDPPTVRHHRAAFHADEVR